jgi:hypothetical protein
LGHDDVPNHQGLVEGILIGETEAANTARDLRALLGLISLHRSETRLRAVFSMAPQQIPKAAQRFELMRLVDRRRMMEVAASWSRDWPQRFRIGASVLGLSQATFARTNIGPVLSAEVARLPERLKPLRPPLLPIVHDAALLRLSRTDKAIYRQRRAAIVDKITQCQA